ncbi:PREDICTED: uncharacterized protein LOC109239178 [Nicotiana attenuata]|uniref:uncharacterized protein LOC109239178 n=1 Tax=Nicotiana attenuata TaxID=49451 RepID=UPI000904C54B|nr:PREDICTED: uncharacterized protein LOC109239178 [Nicotiana attenuata]
MARRRKTLHGPDPQKEKLITPENGIQKELSPLTFGNFLPQKFQSIEEGDELSSSEDESQLKVVKMEEQLNSTVRQLQYSEASGSRKPTPTTADVVRGNRSLQMGKSLSYVPPVDREGKKVVKLCADDLKAQEEYWKTALIRYVIGENPYEKAMENYVLNVWNFVTKPKILMHAEGYCIFRFNSKADRDLVLQSGPYTFRNKPVVLRIWEIDFTFNKDVLSTIPVWVRFPGLPVGFWSTEALSKMASAIGKPLYTDRFTAHYEKISYARVLVEVDVAHMLPDQIEVETPYGQMTQDIEYDWKPSFCNECLRFGHDSMDCWYNMKEEKKQEQGEESEGENKGERQRKRKKRQGKIIKQTWVVKQNQVNEENQPKEDTVEVLQCMSRKTENTGGNVLPRGDERKKSSIAVNVIMNSGMEGQSEKEKSEADYIQKERSGHQAEPRPPDPLKSK